MTTDFRALCAELVNRFDELYGRICDDDTIIYVDNEVNELMNYARAALAEPQPPSLKEQALDAWDRLRNEAWCKEIEYDLDFVRHALEALDG